MTNEELQDAITMANAMVRKEAPDSRTYAALVEHLKTLLREQAARAAVRPTLAPLPAAPVVVQPVIVQPTWVPQQPWQPPYTVTC